MTAYRVAKPNKNELFERVGLASHLQTITAVSPRNELTAAGLLQTTATSPLQYLGPLILRHHALHLGKQLALGSVPEGILQKDPLQAELVKLFNEQLLVGVIAGQAVRRQDHCGIKLPASGGIAQAL